jgi:predicted permease
MRSWLARRLRALLRRDRLERELGEEIGLHVELETAHIAGTTGVPLDEARRRALVAFGGMSRITEEHRDARGVRWLLDLLQDIRYAARGVAHHPGFALSAALILALGIGSTTAAFSAVKAVLRNPNDENLAFLFFRGFPSFSTVDFQAVDEQQRSFTAVGAMRMREAAFTAGAEPEHVNVGAVTSGFFRALGVRPLAGRLIDPQDEPVGAPPVTLVSHALAERVFGSYATAVGQSVNIDGVAHTVVGVLPRTVSAMPAFAADVWPVMQLAQPNRRGPFGMRVIARLRPGVTFEEASADVGLISERIFPLWAAGFQDRTARFEAIPMRKAVLRNASKMIGIFTAAVALVLLIAVANVASLMLVRAIGRSRELALRTVLGASKLRLVRLFLAESLVLAVAGAAVGLALGAAGLRGLIALGPRLPHLAAAHLDLSAVGFALTIALLSGLVAGAYPIVRLVRGATGTAAQGGERAVGGGRQTQRARSAFVVAQFAFAVPLLAVSGLLLNSFLRLQQVDPGFDTSNLLTVRVGLPAARYPDDSLVAQYWARALPLVRAVPGVVSAGVGSDMPPDNYGGTNNFNLIDRPVPAGTSEPAVPWPAVDAEYFTTLGVRLLEGRMFGPADSDTAAPVALASRSWAQTYYPGESAIGRRMIAGGCTTCPPTVIVGVVEDVRYSGLRSEADALYAPLVAGYGRELNLFVRTTDRPELLADQVRGALRSVDPGVPLDDVAPMAARIYATIAQPRHWAGLVGGFAAAALVLTAFGIFGMLSYVVHTRSREIGVRMALGARRNAVVGMVVRYGLTHAAIGTGLGLATALVATRSIATVLFGVGANDPATLAAVTLILLVATLAACWLPARRAAAIDPVEAIRLE